MPLGTEIGLGPGDIVLDGDPAPPQKGAQQPPPIFWPMPISCPSVATKQLPISATAELSFCLLCVVVILCSCCMFAVLVLGLVSSVLAKRMARKNVSVVTFYVEWDLKH